MTVVTGLCLPTVGCRLAGVTAIFPRDLSLVSHRPRAARTLLTVGRTPHLALRARVAPALSGCLSANWRKLREPIASSRALCTCGGVLRGAVFPVPGAVALLLSLTR